MADLDYPTALGASSRKTITLLGQDLAADVMGTVGFGELAFWLATQRRPEPGEVRVFEAVLAALADHGFTPTAIVTRLTYLSAPDSIQGALAAGLLGGGSRFLGVTEDCGRFLHDVLREVAAARWTRPAGTSWRWSTVQAQRAAGRFVPGLGHHVHKEGDPRTPRLMQIAREEGHFGPHLELFAAIGRVHPQVLGRTLPLNGAGVCGAALADLGLPLELLRGFALLARTAGLIGQLAEELRHPVGQRDLPVGGREQPVGRPRAVGARIGAGRDAGRGDRGGRRAAARCAQQPAPAAGPGPVTIAVRAAPITPLDRLCATRHLLLRPAGDAVRAGRAGRRHRRAGDGSIAAGTPVWFATSAGMAPGDGSMRERGRRARSGTWWRWPPGRTRCWSPALGLSAVAAWMALTWRGGLAAGERVLVLGAGGVVGQSRGPAGPARRRRPGGRRGPSAAARERALRAGRRRGRPAARHRRGRRAGAAAARGLRRAGRPGAGPAVRGAGRGRAAHPAHRRPAGQPGRLGRRDRADGVGGDPQQAPARARLHEQRADRRAARGRRWRWWPSTPPPAG